ncbi:MAG: hypothetical protein ACI9FJ_001122, partial [Alteromonadaceae bacterium]
DEQIVIPVLAMNSSADHGSENDHDFDEGTL